MKNLDIEWQEFKKSMISRAATTTETAYIKHVFYLGISVGFCKREDIQNLIMSGSGTQAINELVQTRNQIFTVLNNEPEQKN